MDARLNLKGKSVFEHIWCCTCSRQDPKEKLISFTLCTAVKSFRTRPPPSAIVPPRSIRQDAPYCSLELSWFADTRRIAVLVCPAVPTWDEMQALAPTIKSAFRPVARLRVRAFFSSSCVWCPIRHLNRVGKSAKRSGAFHQTIGGSIRTERSAQQGAVAHLARAANCSEHGAKIRFTDVGLRVDTRLLSGFRQVAGKQREGTLKVIYAKYGFEWTQPK